MEALHRRLGAAICGLAALVAAAPAAAEAETLTVPDPVSRECAAALVPDSPGIATRTLASSPERAIVTARLSGADSSDWDLAVFTPSGVPVAASTAFGSDESAAALAPAGQALTVQACRLDGRKATAELETALDPLRPAPGAGERISLESVAISGAADVERLEQLGVDVTHDVSPGSATVVLYSAAERALLDSAGFEASPLIADLPAADAATREAELSSGLEGRSNLPSGRDTYRQYVDYTTELKALADGEPFPGSRGDDRHLARGSPDPGRRDRPGRAAHRRRPPRLPQLRRPPRPRVAVGRVPDGVRPRPRRPVQPATRGSRTCSSDVRVVIVPMVNVDGFVASRSFGFNPLTDDDEFRPSGRASPASGAYRRKNCRPTAAGEAASPAPSAPSGVDLNRNYGYYWGGPGSSTDPTSQGYRGTAPFSEPESEAVHQFSLGHPPHRVHHQPHLHRRRQVAAPARLRRASAAVTHAIAR